MAKVKPDHVVGLGAAPIRSGWRPIASAPVGRVLAFWDRYAWEGLRVAEKMAVGNGGHFWRDPHSERNLQPPSHWMPLPDPPAPDPGEAA